MARPSTTRERVAAIAAQLHADGVTPTPTTVRKLLGGGSPNTIVAALREWRAQLEPGQEPASRAPNGVAARGAVELARHRGGGDEHRLESSEMLQALSGLQSEIQRLFAQLEVLNQTIEKDRAHAREENTLMATRFEAVQRRMLLSIDESREAARQWKAKADEARMELDTWKLSMTQKNNMLLETISGLREKLARLEGPADPG